MKRGAFLTKLDVYFASKDENEKIRCELRTVELGTPTNQLVTEYSQVTLEPKDKSKLLQMHPLQLQLLSHHQFIWNQIVSIVSFFLLHLQLNMKFG